MKKLIVGLVSAVVLAIGISGNAQAATVVPVTIDSGNHIVLDKPENIVVAKVMKQEPDGGTTVRNIFDDNDNILIEGKYNKGTILLITYSKDIIVNIKANNLNVENKIIGQKFSTTVNVHTYLVTNVVGTKVYGLAMSDISASNKTITINKSFFKDGEVSKGNKILVTKTKQNKILKAKVIR
ncbi:hypothetical protein [Peribacillus frigoritolerans]|uniref:hypothetical protein n=1 Tax=Peribacillus frigoritolerans TaxID=450367 RepID=UPI002E24F182|nr:hypothetical protein [Peribacillus frigoritolerans]